ncbi:MAG: DUF362 domain-containing protein [Deltaproteobacteria bacterium]|jgi:uncharacterized protein|nr:DUF362 domain-containing protein [Deltaproteobacteria bacterium]
MNTKNKPKVFFLPWDRHKELEKLIQDSSAVSGIQKNDYVAVKLHFGERGGDGHIKPEFMRPILKSIKNKKAKPFLTDTNTIYHGPRNNAIGHLEVAAEHGYSQNRMQVPIIIADGLLGDDYTNVDIDGNHFKSVKIATTIRKANRIIAASHFKGHLLAGFGGAIKNLGMGCGAKAGKFEMHCSVAPTVEVRNCVGCELCVPKCAQSALTVVSKKIQLDKNKCVGCGECVIACHTNALSITWSEGTKSVQERFVEYAKGAVKDTPCFYINFLNHISPNCDCMGMKEKPMLDDIGILASVDPVAIDQACYDLVVKKAGDVFLKAHPGIDGRIQLEYAEKLGMGSRDYELKNV